MKRAGRICDKPSKPLNIQARNVTALVWIMESSEKYPRNKILENAFNQRSWKISQNLEMYVKEGNKN